jgi:hypothetical protein
MAGVVIGYSPLPLNRFRLPASLIDQKLAQLKGLGRQLLCPFVPIGPGFKDMGIFDPNHCGAGTAGQHNGRIWFKNFDEAFGEGDGLRPKAAVKKWLAAAGLFLGKFNFVTGLSQEFNSCQPHIRHYLINNTGNAQRDFFCFSHGWVLYPQEREKFNFCEKLNFFDALMLFFGGQFH